MQRTLRITRFVLAFAFPFAVGPAVAATFCVASENALTAALQEAETNSEDNEIRIRAGHYVAAAGEGWHIDLFEGDFSLSVFGGFTDAECTVRSADASATTLDGNHAARPLTIDTSRSFGAANAEHHIIVSGLTFLDGSDAAVGGLKISDPGPIYGGTILVEGNVFLGNEISAGSLEGGPALLAATDGPDFSGGTGLIVRNNLFARNLGPDASAVFVYSNNHVEIVNNTFADNRMADEGIDDRAVLKFFVFSGIGFENNIFWGNNVAGEESVHDLNLTAAVDLEHNDIEFRVGDPGSETGTLAVDPLFADTETDNYTLSSTSPLIDAGVDAPIGGVSSFDLKGATRVQGAHIDLGAYEFGALAIDTIFDDGFEPAP